MKIRYNYPKDIVNTIICDDCLEIMPLIPNKEVNMILCDLPYGTTACSWDTMIPLDELWKEYERIIKDNGAIVLNSGQPFTTALISSNMKMFKYCWVWEKQQGTNPMLAKKQPLKIHEDICVFYRKFGTYNPQMSKGTPYLGFESKTATTGEIMGETKSVHRENILGDRYPTTILKFNTERSKNGHPTQKPVALFEYLIKTYTNEGDLVLDNCAGSFTTAIAATNLKRNWICIEKEGKYCKIGSKRINENKV